MTLTPQEKDLILQLLSHKDPSYVKQGSELLKGLHLSQQELYAFFDIPDSIKEINTLRSALRKFRYSDFITFCVMDCLINQRTDWIINCTQLHLSSFQVVYDLRMNL